MGNPCLHNGTCVPYVPDRKSSVCLCPKDWAGDTCELQLTPCSLMKRGNCYHGECFEDAVGLIHCSCARGWCGNDCSKLWPNVCKFLRIKFLFNFTIFFYVSKHSMFHYSFFIFNSASDLISALFPQLQWAWHLPQGRRILD